MQRRAPDRIHLSRVDLADVRQPDAMAKAVMSQLGEIEPPVPVKAIAKALGISEIRTGKFDGFEGMLLTDRVRSCGAILANDRYGRRRARFTIAHELGHFLMEHHVLSADNGFRCRPKDMRETQQSHRHQRQETQANQFAIRLLAPFQLVDQHLSDDPDLRDGVRLREELDISLEACVRRMIDRRPEALAAVWSNNGRVRYATRNGRFPFVYIAKGDQLPQTTAAFRAIENGQRCLTEFTETHPGTWTDRPDLNLFEQTRVGQNGYAVTLLWAVNSNTGSEDDEPVHRAIDTPGLR